MTQDWKDRIQNYREHLELLCDHSKMEYCVGCGMTIQFFDKIVQETRNATLSEAEREIKNQTKKGKNKEEIDLESIKNIINNLRVK